jgi:hypothetical protein
MKMGWNLAHLTSTRMSWAPIQISRPDTPPANDSEMNICRDIALLSNSGGHRPHATDQSWLSGARAGAAVVGAIHPSWPNSVPGNHLRKG